MDENERAIIEYLDRPGALFDRGWVEEAHALLMLLLGVRSSDTEEEWREFMKLFRAGRNAKFLSDTTWPARRMESVLREWRTYRDMTRDLARARNPGEWLQIAERYPTELVERAMRTPPEKADRDEIYHPLDVIWIALTYGRMNGIDYRECATPGCQRYAAVSFPKRAGRQPRYCAVCNASTRDLLGHKRRKKDHDKRCLEIVGQALGLMPAKQRRIASDADRRSLAKRVFKLARKDLAKIPGKRGVRWIAKQLKKGAVDAKN
jgi:hypothetical protein